MGGKALFALVAAGLAVSAGLGAAAMNAARKTPEARYVTSPAVIGDVELAVLATGTLLPAEVLEVGAETSGRVISLNVSLGDTVKAGDVIAVIDPTQLENLARQAESQVNQIRANLSSMTANLDLQKSNVEREQQLVDRGIGTQVKLDQARNQLAGATANVTQFQNMVNERQLNLENARNNLEKANVRAPIDGVIAEIVTRQGQTVSTTQQVPTIVKMAQMEVMTVRTQISEADIGKVLPGQRVYFTILSDPETRHHATLRTRELTPAGGVMDPSQGGLQRTAIYYNALFETPNKDGVFFPGMTAQVHVVLNEAKGVVTVPSAALGEQGADGRYLVRVVDDQGEVQQRRVRIGLNNNTFVEIREGIAEGEQVIVGEDSGPSAAAPEQPIFGRAQLN